MAVVRPFRFDNDDQPLKVSYPSLWKRHWDGGTKHRRLMTRWAARWPRVFRAEDALLAYSQNRYHFHEWFAARFVAERFLTSTEGQRIAGDCGGADILMEKYYHDASPAKLQVFTEYCNNHGLSDLFDLLRLPKKQRDGQPPDLLVLPEGGKPFFIEVKGGERVSPNQHAFFARIKDAIDAPILLMKLRGEDRPQDRWWSDS